MTKNRQKAYRYLLYRAMLDIRLMRSVPDNFNPKRWFRYYKRAKKMGALAEWLHNLARYSVEDFRGFKEERFWREFDTFAVKFSIKADDWHDYRRHFNSYLEDLETKQKSRIDEHQRLNSPESGSE